METGVEQSLTGALRELKARFTNEIAVRNGQVFRLGWEQVGNPTAIIGPKRSREKNTLALHVNLIDLPTVDNTRLQIQVAKDGWVNIHNQGTTPIDTSLNHLGQESLYGTAPKSPSINRETGKFSIDQGEAIATKQGGSPFRLVWETSDGKRAQLEVEPRKNYINNQDSLQIKFQVLPAPPS